MNMAGKKVKCVRGEDFVEYFLFPSLSSDLSIKETLDNVSAVYQAHLSEHTLNYIWQNEGFVLTPRCTENWNAVTEISDYLPPHLYGCTYYGDNVEDEWFIVFLLKELTKLFSDLLIRVVDSDGEILLIEAAEHLPHWANPDTCENRVFLHKGSVHLIPVAQTPGQVTPIPSGIPHIMDAVTAVRENPDITIASPAVQEAVNKRIEGYPGKITENLHRARLIVPAAVSALLQENAALVAPAVQAFYNRDPIDLKACRAMCYFPPETRVPANVVFTKCLYAMLMQQKYSPDKRTGWNLPPPTSPEFKAAELGMKLACGFEILVAQAKPVKGENSTISLDDLSNDTRWNQYVTTLNSKGYFKGLLEGSYSYMELLEQAKQYYLNHVANSDQSECTPGQQILSLLDTIEYDIEEMKKRGKKLPPPDDDSWLEISPDDLDAMLQNRFGNSAGGSTEATSPSPITDNLRSFLEHMSGLEGVEFPSKEVCQSKLSSMSNKSNKERKISNQRKVSGASRKVSSASNASDASDMSNVSQKIGFDPDSFSTAIQNILDFSIPEDNWDLESDSDTSGMSSYEDEDMEELSGPKVAKAENIKSTKMKDYMSIMDRELASTTVGESFEKKASTEKGSACSDEDGFDDVENFRPVDVDMTALKNILESYKSQQGQAGPASNLLGQMGVNLQKATNQKTD